jgi:AcrR family transcriptional regulator
MNPPATMSTPTGAGRLSAEERRDSVVAAATIEFAHGGFDGTSTDAIARRAGVSQPYLFQLFGTKKELFLAAVRVCFDRTLRHFQAVASRAAAAGDDPAFLLHEMGMAYFDLISDRELLLLQLHAYAACDDDDVRAVVREGFTVLYREVGRMSGADDDSLEQWFAKGMLYNVAAAMGLAGGRNSFSLRSLVTVGGASED